MLPDVHHEVDFMQWLDALPDDEVLIVLEVLRGIVAQLEIPIVDKQPFATQDVLNFLAHRLIKVSLN